jgi:hypothetical protein
MSALSQVARLPKLAGSLGPFRIGVDTSADISPQVATVRYADYSVNSPMPVWSARNITLNPFRFSVIKYPYYGENQAPSYYDQDYEIRGVVLDSDSNPMERRVLLHTRDGTKIGVTRSNSDGTFKFRVWNYGLNRTLVTAIPDDGDLRNAVVKWGVIGVVPV